MTMVGSATVVGSAITADPVTMAASVDPVTTVGLATMAGAITAAAATTKPVPAQATVASPRPSLLCVLPRAELSRPRLDIKTLRSRRVSAT
jgi:hypothetical protein